MLCYNCYFLTVGNIFTDKQIEQMEEHKPINHGHDADWYEISTFEYSNINTTKGYTIKGFHPFVRMVFTSNAGVVTNILAR